MSGVGSRPPGLLDFGKNFGNLRFRSAEGFSALLTLGPNRDARSGFCCLCFVTGDSLACSKFPLFPGFFEQVAESWLEIIVPEFMLVFSG